MIDRARYMDPGCRMALAGFLHDLGKLAERAGLFAGDPALEINRQLYCPYHLPPQGYHRAGWFSHLHAAATALAFDRLERRLPNLLDGDPAPFVPRRRAGEDRDATDSLVNAAAAHHKPDTFLQWCVASADRIASGFEREAFETYNRAEEPNHIQARLLVPFEEYGRETAPNKQGDLKWRYPLRPLSPEALFPIPDPMLDLKTAGTEYRAVWDWFEAGLEKIPASHRASWSLWLDHFDSLWLAASHAIPAATAFGTRPEVSLYDHSKTTAALAVALWRYHDEAGDSPDTIARKQKDRADWGDEKFLLIQGDFCGIQNFIFGGSAQTQKGAAKLLRGRSAMVALLTELAALRVLDDLALPPTSQIINAAGKFLIVAPNTGTVRAALTAIRTRLDDWFLEHAFGLASIALAVTGASSNDFIMDFAGVQKRLIGALEIAKRQRFDLCGDDPAAAIFQADFRHGVCAVDGRLPAEETVGPDDMAMHPFSRDQYRLGEALADPRIARLLIFADTGSLPVGDDVLATSLFGYRVMLTGDEEASGKFGSFAADGGLRRAFDLSLPKSRDPIWHGYARRPVNAYVPLFHDGDDHDADDRYAAIDPARPGGLKTFEHLACDDRERDAAGNLVGVKALGVLKGDVDDLGKIFRDAFGKKPTFAKWAALSRRMDVFFSVYIPWKCQSVAEFNNIYTVFAGGDDFFFIGPWHSVKKFSLALTQDFSRYCAENDRLHFSAGYAMVKPGYPLGLLSEQAETALAQAKSYGEDKKKNLPARKCALHLHGETVSWADYAQILMRQDALGKLVNKYGLSTAFLYDVLQLTDMAGDNRPESARWRSLLFYRTRRDVFDRQGKRDDDANAAVLEIVKEFGEQGIGKMQRKYRIVLSDHLYRVRG